MQICHTREGAHVECHHIMIPELKHLRHLIPRETALMNTLKTRDIDIISHCCSQVQPVQPLFD